MSEKPRLEFLSSEDKKKIHETAVRILEQIGMSVRHDEAERLLKDAGCTSTDDHIVKVPESLVKKALASAPDHIPIFDRTGKPAMDLGGYRAYYGTGSDLMYRLDPVTGDRKLCVLEDVKQAAMVCDALDNIDFIMSCAHPSDIPPRKSYLTGFQSMVEHSIKPIVCTAEGRNDLARMRNIAAIVRNSDAALEQRPYFIHYAEPISPLKHPFNSLDKLLFCAENRIPVIYSPAPIAGSTAPMTIAGHVAQGLAESLFGLVVHQLKNEGAPFLMGMGAAVLDMRTSQCSYNAPEYLMAYMAMVEMSHFHNLPSWGYAGTSDAQIPDGQATFEAGLLCFLSEISGANLNHDVGYLDFGLTGSLEMIVICDEIIDQVRRINRGILVNDDTLAFDAVKDVGSTGHFLTNPHTLKHLRTTQWRPKLMNRFGYEQWESRGSKTLLDVAGERLKTILEARPAAALSDEMLRDIKAQVDGY